MEKHTFKILVACTSGACDAENMNDQNEYEAGTILPLAVEAPAVDIFDGNNPQETLIEAMQAVPNMDDDGPIRPTGTGLWVGIAEYGEPSDKEMDDDVEHYLHVQEWRMPTQAELEMLGAMQRENTVAVRHRRAQADLIERHPEDAWIIKGAL